MTKNRTTTLKATEARNKFFEILKKIDKPNRVYTVTLDGKFKAVILSADEYESWLETLEVMADPKLMKEIKGAREDFKKGEYVTLEEALEEEGYILAKKPKKKHARVPSSHKEKSAKKLKKNR